MMDLYPPRLPALARQVFGSYMGELGKMWGINRHVAGGAVWSSSARSVVRERDLQPFPWEANL